MHLSSCRVIAHTLVFWADLWRLTQPVIGTHVLHLFQDVVVKPTPAEAARKEAFVVLSKL